MGIKAKVLPCEATSGLIAYLDKSRFWWASTDPSVEFLQSCTREKAEKAYEESCPEEMPITLCLFKVMEGWEKGKDLKNQWCYENMRYLGKTKDNLSAKEIAKLFTSEQEEPEM